MANRIFIIPRRTDFPGMSVAIWDLWPNNPQKNNGLDGEGQTFYMGSCLDLPGVTLRNGDAYMGGSTNTSLAAVDAPVTVSTVGAANNANVTETACFGLAAYIRERCKDGVGNTPVTEANSILMAAAIRTIAEAGGSLINSAIDTALNGIRAGTRIDANDSFGTVEDVLKILSGEVYRCPRYTILASDANAWITNANRDVLVAAQVTGLTGRTYVSHGGFLTSLESGFRGRPILARTGSANISMAEGQLHTWSHNMTFLNPSFAYAAADVTIDRPRASDIAGTAIAATGVHAGLRVYLLSNIVANSGTCLL